MIGQTPSGEPVSLDPKLRQSTHMHVIGSSGRGKSKFLEMLIRKDIEAGHGICLIDWHGTLYKDVLQYCAHLGVGLPRLGIDDYRSPILLDPSRPDFITGFNPFMNPGADISTQVTRRIKATIRPWGVSNTNDMPTFEFVARLLYTFMAETGQTLANAANLLDPEQKALRAYAIQTAGDSYTKEHWRRLQQIKSMKDWEDKVLSTENRLARFIGSKAIKRFMGLTHNNLDLMEVMDTGKILLVNLGASDFLDEEAARVFASLFLYEFMHTAMRRANRSQTGEKPKHFILYLDEFQEYITDDIASMLEQVRKGGLHMVLAHQHLAQLVKDGNERLKDSIFTNCRIKAVFGGLPYKSAEELASEMLLPDLNSRQIKATYTRTIHLYDEEIRTQQSRASGTGDSEGRNWSDSKGRSTTHGSSSGSGGSFGHGSSSGLSSTSSTSMPENIYGFNGADGVRTSGEISGRMDSDSYAESSFSSESESDSKTQSHTRGTSTARSTFSTQGETVVPFLKPRAVQELLPDVEWTLGEKRSRVAEMIISQPQQHCFLKLDTAKTLPMIVEFVKDYGLSAESLLEYQLEIYKAQGALPAGDVDRLIEESRVEFLASASPVIENKSTEDDDSAKAAGATAPQSGTSPWKRTETRDPKPALGGEPRQRRTPGPSTDMQNYAKVVRIVGQHGKDWINEERLQEICEALDAEGVPTPKTWLTRSDGKSRSWNRGLQNYKQLVIQAIRDRFKAVGAELP